MTRAQTRNARVWSLMGQAEHPPSVLFGETEIELWPYRRRTVSAVTALCPGLGRGREAAVSAGTRVFPVTGHVVHDEKL